MARTDDELMRDLIDVSGDRATMYRRPFPRESTPVYAGLHWWMSLEDLDDEGNLVTLDNFTSRWPWEDYTHAAKVIGPRAIWLTPVLHESRPDVAYVRFVHSCIETGQTTGRVRTDDIYYLALVNVRHGTTRWDTDQLWRVWNLTQNQPASVEELKPLG